MFIAGSLDDFTDQDKNIGNVIGAKPMDILYSTDVILANCPTVDHVEQFLIDTPLMGKESLIGFFKKEFLS